MIGAHQRFVRKVSWVDTCGREDSEAGIRQKEMLGCSAKPSPGESRRLNGHSELLHMGAGGPDLSS